MLKQHISYILLSVALACFSLATASERIELSLGTIAGDGWSAEQLSVDLDLKDNSAQLKIKQLQLPSPLTTAHNISASCASVDISGPVFTCRGGKFQLEHPWLDAGAFDGDISFDQRKGTLSLALNKLPVAGGKMKLQAGLQGKNWHLSGNATGLDLARIQQLAAIFAELPAGDISGSGNIRFDLHNPGGILAGKLELDLQRVNLASDDGNIASEDLTLQLLMDLRKQAESISVFSTVRSQHGQVYIAPVFVDTASHPLTIKANGRWDGKNSDLHLTDIRLEQPGALSAEATLHWQQSAGVQDMSILLHEAQLPDAYELYAQPFLIGTGADSLLSSGKISGTAQYSQGQPHSLRLALTDINLIDSENRFKLNQLNGTLHWQAEANEARVSEINWKAGALASIPLGTAKAKLELHGDNVRLLQPLHLPILTGALNIRTLQLNDLATSQRTAVLKADLTPIALGAISKALDWPELSGTVAGKLPTLRYEDGEFTLDGRFEVEIFKGHLYMDDLILKQPFGKVPRLSADIALEKLDLRLLTEAFSFGRIEGLISGRIDHLRLVNWQPASFSADFYTPPDDKSRHRISQRAIQNLSSIGGGGAAAALSRGFLRFFEDFAYDRIGLSCQLQQNVCVMGGIAPADNGGYYIVRGKLLPRIDVIGFQRKVSWPTLIEQLKSVIHSEGPVVE